MTYTPIHTARLYEQIVEQIETRILSGELKPGDKLPTERELAEQFGVSRTAVREAVKALIRAGLIEAHPGRGTFVTSRVPTGVREMLDQMLKHDKVVGTRNLVEVREVLEPEIAVLAAARAKDEHIAAMQHAVDVMDRSLNDINTFIDADQDFHLALTAGTCNPLFVALMDSLVDVLRDARARIALVEGGMRRSQEHHKRILQAVSQHNVTAAREAMRAHLLQVRMDGESSVDIVI
jgi:GntR family transcriptional repressor for pyruvate dehydrogenase complex